MSKGHTERIAAVGEAISGIQDAEQIFESGFLSWPTKFNMIFKIHSTSVSPNLGKLGVEFDWYNPDGDYDEDTRAYMTAARSLLKDLKVVRTALMSEGD